MGTTTTSKTTGQWLRRVRRAAGKRAEEMAAEMGPSYRTIVRWEMGESEPTFSELVRWAQITGADLSELLDEMGTDPDERHHRCVVVRDGRPTREMIRAPQALLQPAA